MDLGGVLIPAVTPFDPVSGDVDLVGYRGNLRLWLEHPVRGIVVSGSTGEAVLLDDDERTRLLEGVREIIPSDRLLVAGTGAESRRTTIRLTQSAAAAGADAVLVQPPAYYKAAMTPEVLRDHYQAVADASPIPVIIYQVPLRFSTIDFPTGLLAELSTHPNIVAVKDSRGNLDLVGDLVTQTQKGFQVLVGSGAHLFASLEIGVVGGILGVANVAPAESSALHRAFLDGRSSEAGRLQERIGPVHNEIVAKRGVPGVKAAMNLLGYQGGRPRPPLRELSPEEEERVRAVLVRARLLD
jgi:4-hydroxy-2-oxoglutarate aldolase